MATGKSQSRSALYTLNRDWQLSQGPAALKPAARFTNVVLSYHAEDGIDPRLTRAREAHPRWSSRDNVRALGSDQGWT
jgi:hypothetical protein